MLGPWEKKTSRVERRGLPPRVRRIMSVEKARADRTGGWAVAICAMLMGWAYLVSPAGGGEQASFEPVPVVVAAFVAAGLARVAAARSEPLPAWLVLVFVAIDFGLLYGLVLSYHVQYREPLGFALQAPTMLFVFVLIAVRALRLEPWPVIAAGATAAVGWTGVATAALAAGPRATGFKDYVMGTGVLPGAEAEKILAIVAVTAILAIGIERGRSQLVQAATGAAARENLARFFPSPVAERIGAEDALLEPGFGETRYAAILMADIRGFTGIASRHDPDLVMSVLVEYQRMVGRIVGRHGGEIDKFLGDGVLATFGCARPNAAPSASATSAIADLVADAPVFERWAAEKLGEKLAVGYSVSSGTVLCGTVGDGRRLEFTVIGEPVNVAAKIEKANKLLSTVAVCDAQTVARARLEGADPSYDFSLLGTEVPGLAVPRTLMCWRARV